MKISQDKFNKLISNPLLSEYPSLQSTFKCADCEFQLFYWGRGRPKSCPCG